MHQPQVINPSQTDQLSEEHWFCIKTRTKSEHIAAAHLRKFTVRDVFSPRIRFQRNTRRGKIWFVEALFPGYIFAKFNFPTSHRAVNCANAVTRILSFGGKIPILPEETIQCLIAEIGGTEIVIEERPLQLGERVALQYGPLQGVTGLITRLLPGKKRVEVLLDFLGQQRAVELPGDTVQREETPTSIQLGETARPGFIRQK